MILLLLTLCAGAQSSNYTTFNRNRAGQRIRVEDYIKRGKMTIVEFYSSQSQACQMLSPKLQALAQSRSDIHVGRINIDRAGREGIDWRSPVASQHRLTSLPYLKVYDSKGKLILEGIPARRKLFSLLREEELL